MPVGEPNTPTTQLCKLRPQAKLPTPAVMHALPPADVKLLKRLLTEPVEYLPHALFDAPPVDELLQQPLQEWWRADRDCDDSGVYTLESPAGDVTTLDREQYLFLRLNYCRRRVFTLLEQYAGRRLSAEVAGELLDRERAVMAARAEIARKNMPLVLAMAKRTRITGVDVTDLISEGNLALLRAVNKFDCSRGYKFSTYACRAILKSFSRVATRMARYRGHFPTEFDPALEKSNYLDQVRTTAEGDCVHDLKTILTENLAELTDVEHTVVTARFALDAAESDPAHKVKTLEQVGEMIGVTKERVRQIQNKALSKLRAALEQVALAR